jgi:hypothetical protein
MSQPTITVEHARAYLEQVLPGLRQFDWPSHHLVARFGLTASQAEQATQGGTVCQQKSK